MRKVSSCFLRLHLCDVIQFRDDHARMRIRGPLAPSSCLKFWQRGKLFWALMTYLKGIFGNIRTYVGNKIQKKEDLPYGWLTHWKWATMVAKTRPVRVTRGGWCYAWLTRRFFKACAIARFRHQFARGQKTIGSHLNGNLSKEGFYNWGLVNNQYHPGLTKQGINPRISTLALSSSSGGWGGGWGGSESNCQVVPSSCRKRDESDNLKLSGAWHYGWWRHWTRAWSVSNRKFVSCIHLWTRVASNYITELVNTPASGSLVNFNSRQM